MGLDFEVVIRKEMMNYSNWMTNSNTRCLEHGRSCGRPAICLYWSILAVSAFDIPNQRHPPCGRLC